MIKKLVDSLTNLWYDEMSEYKRNRYVLIKKQIDEQGYNYCEYCGRAPLQKYNDTKRNFLTVDHIIPKAIGGDNDIENLRIACIDCNRIKGSKLLNRVG